MVGARSHGIQPVDMIISKSPQWHVSTMCIVKGSDAGEGSHAAWNNECNYFPCHELHYLSALYVRIGMVWFQMEVGCTTSSAASPRCSHKWWTCTTHPR